MEELLNKWDYNYKCFKNSVTSRCLSFKLWNLRNMRKRERNRESFLICFYITTKITKAIDKRKYNFDCMKLLSHWSFAYVIREAKTFLSGADSAAKWHQILSAQMPQSHSERYPSHAMSLSEINRNFDFHPWIPVFPSVLYSSWKKYLLFLFFVSDRTFSICVHCFVFAQDIDWNWSLPSSAGRFNRTIIRYYKLHTNWEHNSESAVIHGILWKVKANAIHLYLLHINSWIVIIIKI